MPELILKREMRKPIAIRRFVQRQILIIPNSSTRLSVLILQEIHTPERRFHSAWYSLVPTMVCRDGIEFLDTFIQTVR